MIVTKLDGVKRRVDTFIENRSTKSGCINSGLG